MKIQTIAIVLTVINLILMTFLLAEMRPARAQLQGQNSSQMLRGRGLEIIDSSGKVRASITLQPAVVYGGKNYSQSVLLRLINTKGKPMIKLGAAEEGSGLTLIDEFDEGVVIHGYRAGSFVKISNKGKEKIMQP